MLGDIHQVGERQWKHQRSSSRYHNFHFVLAANDSVDTFDFDMDQMSMAMRLLRDQFVLHLFVWCPCRLLLMALKLKKKQPLLRDENISDLHTNMQLLLLLRPSWRR